MQLLANWSSKNELKNSTLFWVLFFLLSANIIGKKEKLIDPNRSLW